ncbi:MAG: DUF1599 domain-containing protein [bacterium]
MEKTFEQVDQVIAGCRNIFASKNRDYGKSWIIWRPMTVIDQIFIKAKRIKTIEENGSQKISDSIDSEYRGILNYAIVAIMLVRFREAIEKAPDSFDEEKILLLYDEITKEAKDLMEKKNTDYGEAWRDMEITSMTDMILGRVYRLKAIINGKEINSEGPEANFLDTINYATFALIKLSEQKPSQ